MSASELKADTLKGIKSRRALTRGGWQLKRGRALACEKARQEHHLAVWKLQRGAGDEQMAHDQ
jgi:hypothetical protein